MVLWLIVMDEILKKLDRSWMKVAAYADGVVMFMPRMFLLLSAKFGRKHL